MRNRNVKLSAAGRIIYARLEAAPWLEELRLECNVALHVNSTYRRSVPGNLVHKFLLRRRREIHACLRAQMRVEKINVVLNDNALHGLVAECSALLRHRLFVRIQKPITNTEQQQYDDQNGHDLP